jgi:hypothetical protein
MKKVDLWVAMNYSPKEEFCKCGHQKKAHKQSKKCQVKIEVCAFGEKTNFGICQCRKFEEFIRV